MVCTLVPNERERGNDGRKWQGLDTMVSGGAWKGIRWKAQERVRCVAYGGCLMVITLHCRKKGGPREGIKAEG